MRHLARLQPVSDYLICRFRRNLCRVLGRTYCRRASFPRSQGYRHYHNATKAEWYRIGVVCSSVLLSVSLSVRPSVYHKTILAIYQKIYTISTWNVKGVYMYLFMYSLIRRNAMNKNHDPSFSLIRIIALCFF